MEEQNRLILDIQARVSNIIGLSEAKQSIADEAKSLLTPFSPQAIKGHYEDLRQDPLYQNSLEQSLLSGTPLTEVRRVQKGMTGEMIQGMSISQEQLHNTYERISNELQMYSDMGKVPSISTRMKYQNWINRSVDKGIDEIQKGFNEVTDGLDKNDPIVVAEKQIMEQNIKLLREGGKEFNDHFEKMIDVMRRGGEQTENFYKILQKTGIAALGALVGNQILKGVDLYGDIQSRAMTAFDFSNPIGNYSQQRMYDVWKENAERSFGFSTVGGIAGGTLGFMVGGPVGAAAGFGAGSAVTGAVANYFNKIDQAQVESELKFFSNVYGIASQDVNSVKQYDISLADARARFGQDIQRRQLAGLGITPDQELQMRLQFAESRGGYDPQAFEKQASYARRFRLDPNEFNRFNIVHRLSGTDVTEFNRESAFNAAKSMYGENSARNRQLELLEESKNIFLKMLSISEKAEFDRAQGLTMLPHLLLGNSPYGNPGQMGSRTLEGLANIANSQSDAQDAFLYQAYGETSPFEYLSRRRGGFFYKDNAERILRYIKKMAQASPYDAKMALFQMTDLPGDIVEQISGRLQNMSSIEMRDLIRSMNPELSDKEKQEAEKSFKNRYGYSLTRIESIGEENREKQIKAAEDYLNLFLDFEKNTRGFYNELLKNSNTYEELTNKLKVIIEKLYGEMHERVGYNSEAQLNQNYHNQKYNSIYEYGKKHGVILTSNGMNLHDYEARMAEDVYKADEKALKEKGWGQPGPKQLEMLRDKIQRDLDKIVNDTESEKNKALEKFNNKVGWGSDIFDRLQNKLESSLLGKKYDIHFLAGYDPTGKKHGNSSQHYDSTGNAVDFYFTDSKGGRYSYGQISQNKELFKFLQEASKELGFVYGIHDKERGNKLDDNHIQRYTAQEHQAQINIHFSGISNQAMSEIQNSNIKGTIQR